MSLGISVYNQSPLDLIELARAADSAGFDALWLSEHIFSCDYSSIHPMTENTQDTTHNEKNVIDPDVDLPDPWVTFGGIAAVTRRLKMATGIYLLPLRHPLITARHMITLQRLSGERFMLGVGSGWIEEEFDILGVPFDNRGARMNETIEIIRLAEAGKDFEYRGEIFDFPRVQLCAQPVSLPVIVGGNSPPALRRAARLGDGWFSSGIPYPEDALRLRDQIMKLRDKEGDGKPFRTYFRIKDADPALVEQYRKEGIEDVVIWSEQMWDMSLPLDRRHERFAGIAEALELQATSP